MSERRAYQTLLNTIDALAQRKEDELWQDLLYSAVEVVAGAEAGTLFLKSHSGYVAVAQTGYNPALVGLQVSPEAAISWYGDPLRFAEGEPRIASGEALARIIENRKQSLPPQVLQTFETSGKLAAIQASLCLPIKVGEATEAYINLESHSSPDAFSPQSVQDALLYAVQVAALVASLRGRGELEARLREFEVITNLTKALQSALTSDAIAELLAQEIAHLMDSPHVDILLLEGSGSFLQAKASLGLFAKFKHNTVPRGVGLSWACLEQGQMLHLSDVLADPRNYNPLAEKSPPHSQLSTPLLDSKGQPLGVIHAARDLPNDFEPQDRRLMELIASVAATTLERARAMQRLEHQLQESQTLLRTVKVLALGDEAHIWQDLLDSGVLLVPGAEGGSIFLREQDRFRMMAQRGYSDALLGMQVQHPIHLEGGEAAHRWLQGEPTIIHRRIIQRFAYERLNVLEPGEASRIRTHSRLPELQASLSAPIVRGGEVLAFINFDNFSDPQALEHSIEAAHKFALQIAALVAARRERTERERAYEGSLRAIGVALEARDLETAGHTDRVAELAGQVGAELGLSAEELRQLRWGAYLHDIGKLAIPDHILLKPQTLDSEETHVLRTHADLGYSFTQNLPFLPEGSRQVVHFHHEHWDGGGYPGHLSGEGIPLLARIFSVCDVFDALISPRPYKLAWGIPEAIQEIKRLSGKQFDPRVVSAFLTVIERNPNILDEQEAWRANSGQGSK